MTSLPITPHLRSYRGSKPNLRQKTAEQHADAWRVANHLNALIANNPANIQVYSFANIALDLNLTVDEVRWAISDGGYSGITIGVDEVGRAAMDDLLKQQS